MDPLPSIWVTDPQRQDAVASFPLSPPGSNSQWDGEFRRPSTPVARKDSSRPTSPSATATKVFRVLSNNVSASNQNKDGSSGAQLEVTVTIDPLTQQIFNRTGETAPVAPRQNSNDTAASVHDSDRPRGSRSPAPPAPVSRVDSGQTRHPKSKDKGVSFLSRIIGGKKREQQEQTRDDVSVVESRPEGHDAQIFSPMSSNAEFNAAKSQAPDYIRVRTRHTKRKHFDALFLAQELSAGTTEKCHGTARRKSSTAEPPTVWAAEFSKDGKYLATAGHDQIVRIWAVLASPEERHAELRRGSGSSHGSVPNPRNLTAQVFRSKPVKEYQGHTGTVLDLSWSKNNFLLSSSMDKTVRLWHISRSECLCTFKHSDFVPTVAFHPKDDRFFLAGSLDRKIRMWSIPEKHVSFWHQTPEMVTAVAFTPDGKTVIAGSAEGLLTFYETEGLRYQTQIRAKSAHGKNAKGSKITGIQSFQHPLNTAAGDTKLLVTTNDSRVRLYNFRDKSVEMKMKGCNNNSSQIRGSVSDDQRYICCGSEDNRAYIWPLDFDDNEDPTRRPLEHFQAHNSPVTCVRFAPTKTRFHLARSCDPIYDLCSPPITPIRLDRASSTSSSHAPTDNIDGAPEPSLRQSTSLSTPTSSRATHPDGNIIITCSLTGAIKVFRQDCAVRHRVRPTKAASVLSSSRPSSLRTKSSNRSLRSGRDSTSTQPPTERIMSWRQNVTSAPSVRTGSISSKHSTRSLSPRKSSQQARSVSGPAPRGTGIKTPTDSFVSSGVSTPASQSPALFSSGSLKMTKIDPSVASRGGQRVGSGPAAFATHPAREKPVESVTPKGNAQAQAQSSGPVQPAPVPVGDKAHDADDRDHDDHNDHKDHNDEAKPAPPDDRDEHLGPLDANPLLLLGEQSNLFWNVALQREVAERAKRDREAADKERESERWHDAETGLRPDGGVLSRRGESYVSRLSIELSVSGGSGSGSGSDGGSRSGSGSEDDDGVIDGRRRRGTRTRNRTSRGRKRRSGESVIVTPRGTRDTTNGGKGEVGRKAKGEKLR
ncbi:hypothetical protein CAC42_2531 [Sphaceloma murrayae]|uniref:WD repeat-containing protein 44 n=1 Tax=Sphaceloma murrayae TaxID=2082308 RepID=A0A2K1QWC2_9PEZI|nr:hypothetical protein CAC42_2531 [Sphaceloma murrayae]